MDGLPRSELKTSWFNLSNRDIKLLLVRKRNHTDTYRDLLGRFNEIELISEFELGIEWQRFTCLKGSYLMVSSQYDHLAIASFILGKLRGAIYFRFESINDLPYLWNYYGQQLNWLNG